MQLQTLVDGTGLRIQRGNPALDLLDLHDDSRRVTPGSAFIARTGADGDGLPYIAAAIDAGAAVIIAPPAAAAAVPHHVALVTGDPIDQALTGRLAERFFGQPSRKLQLIGVTGTSGKTTTAFLIQHLLREAGVPTGLIGTVTIDDGARRRPSDLTTPGGVEFSRLLARMVDHGCRAAVAEVSSHALHQGRVAALTFAAGVLTNLTRDHLDYHGTMDAYADAKAILFDMLGDTGWAIVNADDLYAQRMVANAKAKVLWTSLRDRSWSVEAGEWRLADGNARCRATVLDIDARGSLATFDGPWGSVEVKLPLVGKHNVANTLQAIAVANAIASGMSRVLRRALETAPQVPGRLERVGAEGPGGQGAKGPAAASDPSAPGPLDPLAPSVAVDYAHKADALENVLLALRPLTRGRLICVFGCGGDRDRTKRPKMAAIAARLADVVWITSDNPRTEDPQAIIRDVAAGVPAEAMRKVRLEADRAAAIRGAILAAQPEDTVLLAGKGHEDYQIIGKTKRHFDDREHAAEALAAWRQSHPEGAAA